jgi:hypothetical protein
MDSSASGLVWYLDSGASFHMKGDTKESFIDLEEKDLIMHIEMGDDGRYSETGIGTITLLVPSFDHVLCLYYIPHTSNYMPVPPLFDLILT